MKNLFKMILAVVMLTVGAYGATASYPLSTTSTPIVVLTNVTGRINSITMANASAAAITLKFYDGIYTSLTYTNAAYSNNVVSAVSTITTNLSITGRAQARTNTVLNYTPTAVAATVVTLNPIAQYTVPAGSTLIATPISPLTFGTGLIVGTSATNIAATVDYTPNR